MRVLVTGGAGFVGAHLSAALVAGGDEVTVLDNLHRGSRARVPDGARFVEGDLRDVEMLRTAMRGAERVYHLAAQSNVLGAVTDVDYSFTTNVVGTYNVLAAARDAGVERVVFSSSREAYGEVDQLPVAEDRAMKPKNTYGASKVAGEVYCRAFQSTFSLDVSVVRLANVYGPGDHGRVIPLWLERAHRGEDRELYGGEQVIDFVPVETVVAALQQAAETPLEGQPVNVGSGKGTTLRELAARVSALPGASGDVRVVPARQVEVTRFVADVTRMRSLLSVEPPPDPLVGLEALWEQIRGATETRK
ncbi:MAG TPA: NAD-dependent epimerase/dehydratase family protein [Ktedonobacterales bacterium]|nr:NAD-dependent epimerase/dehydratase family protein [Ktedonobacterales bacterium]